MKLAVAVFICFEPCEEYSGRLVSHKGQGVYLAPHTSLRCEDLLKQHLGAHTGLSHASEQHVCQQTNSALQQGGTPR